MQILTDSPAARNFPEKIPATVLGGADILLPRQTGWKPVPPKAAGTEAHPTNLFMF